MYCTTADDFEKDLTTPPALTLTTHHSRVGVRTDVHFWLSKESHVGIVEVLDGKTLFETSVRYRTVGDMTCTGAVRSRAQTLEEVVAEIAATRITERGETRADDRVTEAAMEDRKREGYF